MVGESFVLVAGVKAGVSGIDMIVDIPSNLYGFEHLKRVIMGYGI